MIGLDQTAAIYTPGSDGDYTVLAKSGLACRLVVTRQNASSPAEERVDPASGVMLLWGPGYTMPGNAQALIGGSRYNVQAQTAAKIRGASSAVIYQRAAVEIVL